MKSTDRYYLYAMLRFVHHVLYVLFRLCILDVLSMYTSYVLYVLYVPRKFELQGYFCGYRIWIPFSQDPDLGTPKDQIQPDLDPDSQDCFKQAYTYGKK